MPELNITRGCLNADSIAEFHLRGCDFASGVGCHEPVHDTDLAPTIPFQLEPPSITMASSSSNVVGVHYRVGKKIGEGSFGVIFEGTNLLNNQQVAIKFVCCTLKEAVAEKKQRVWEKKETKLRRKRNEGSPFSIEQEPRKSDAPQLRDEYRTYKILVGCCEFQSFSILKQTN